MNKWLSILIPRLLTDTVVLQENDGELQIVCSYEDIEPGEMFDGMCELQIFTWFNWSFPFSEALNVRSFEPKVEP